MSLEKRYFILFALLRELCEAFCYKRHEWHSSRCAIRLLGMEKKKKEKDGEAINQRLCRPADMLKDYREFYESHKHLL